LKSKSKKINIYQLKHEYPGRALVTLLGIFLIVVTISLVFYIASKGLATFFQNGISPFEFLFSTKWKPDAETPKVGALIFIFGSICVSSLALLLAAPFSISTAIFMTEISPKLGKKLLQPAIEIFVGIPSVVYGWIGLSIVVPFIRKSFGGLGFSLLAGVIVLAVMIFPTIASVSADAIKALPKDYLRLLLEF